ncbi:hypothetical protein SAMN05216302_104424 [Nitrosomonas aestuarii]|uniref:Uncharacterized protein n=1 Tax=Nitrosomonas aestuarii TaxID=52441 RepID=A0A1I4G0Y0_9PROT|nr:hypothetical protein SAMN05216302_104424 [Nitrosomonas aestuarii]
MSLLSHSRIHHTICSDLMTLDTLMSDDINVTDRGGYESKASLQTLFEVI